MDAARGRFNETCVSILMDVSMFPSHFPHSSVRSCRRPCKHVLSTCLPTRASQREKHPALHDSLSSCNRTNPLFPGMLLCTSERFASISTANARDA